MKWLIKIPCSCLIIFSPIFNTWAQEENEFSDIGELPAQLVDGQLPPVTSLFYNKVTTQFGRGPENSALGSDRKNFYSLRYEPSFYWFSPEQKWPKWTFYTRAWINYDSQYYSPSLQEDGGSYENSRTTKRPRYAYAELREFYIRRGLLWDDPRFSITAGRQRFYDKYGIWWDDSLESIRFDYNNTLNSGFLAVSQKFWNYNTDVNKLDEQDKKIVYVMGQYEWQWSPRNWLGTRFLYENDYSGRHIDDSNDFKGSRIGVFIKGDDQRVSPLFNDYHVEFVRMQGKRRTIDDNYNTEKNSVNGWLLLGEVGKRFDEAPWKPRVFVYGGLTDNPKDQYHGYQLNRIQTDRLTTPGSYSTRLVSSFVRLDMSNLMFYGIGIQTNPADRTRVDFRISDIKLRNSSAGLPIRVSQEISRERNQQITNNNLSGSKSVGQVFDINYYWQMFPYNYQGKHFTMNTLLNLSYFKSGSAAKKVGDDYQITLGLVFRY